MEAAAPISKNYGRNLKKSINRTFSSTPCENLAPINYQNGILQTPSPILYHSFPPFFTHQKQPPLLPLPISKLSVHEICESRNSFPQHYNTTLSQNRAFSLPSTTRKVNRNVKSNKSSPKKDQKSLKSSKVVMAKSTNNSLGPDPKDLTKDVSTVGVLNSCYARNSIKNDGDKYQLSSDYARNLKKDDFNMDQLSLFTTVSPPPSSLPLPTFSLRPKLISCNAEASAGVDAGATDNLRRLLRLR